MHLTQNALYWSLARFIFSLRWLLWFYYYCYKPDCLVSYTPLSWNIFLHALFHVPSPPVLLHLLLLLCATWLLTQIVVGERESLVGWSEVSSTVEAFTRWRGWLRSAPLTREQGGTQVPWAALDLLNQARPLCVTHYGIETIALTERFWNMKSHDEEINAEW